MNRGRQAFLYGGHSSRWTGDQKSSSNFWPILRERAQPRPLTWGTWMPPHHAIPPVLGSGTSLPSPGSQTCVHISSVYPQESKTSACVYRHRHLSPLVCACIQVSTAHLVPQQGWQLPWEAHQVGWLWLVPPFVPGSAWGSTPRGEEVKGEKSERPDVSQGRATVSVWQSQGQKQSNWGLAAFPEAGGCPVPLDSPMDSAQ